MNRTELMAKVAYEGEWSSYAWPGGYPLSYITSDGGELCPECMNDSTNPIHFMDEDDSNDGWLVVDAYSGGETDEEMSCDHCNKVMQEAFKETATDRPLLPNDRLGDTIVVATVFYCEQKDRLEQLILRLHQESPYFGVGIYDVKRNLMITEVRLLNIVDATEEYVTSGGDV